MNNATHHDVGVVVGVDGTEQGYAAARYGAAEARRLGTVLELVHVLPGSIPVAPEFVPILSDMSLQSYGAEILDTAHAAAVETAPDIVVETSLRSGNRAQELVSASEQARMVVIGSRSPRNLDRIWTGGTVTAVVSRAACPVVVVPAEWDPHFVHGRIAVGVKTPGDARELYDAALALAGGMGADLVVLHAWRLEGIYDDIIADRTNADRWRQAQTALIEHDLADLRPRYPEVAVRTYVRHEEPAHALVRVTCGVDRVLLQRPPAGRVMHHLGRVCRAVLRDSRCPVEVLPEPGSQVLVPEDHLRALV